MHCIPVEEPSQVGEARRCCASLCREQGLDETTSGRASIAVTELATNLARHAKKGRILLQPLERSGRLGVELLSIDSGPGMAEGDRCMTDGYSTAGSPGTGLGSLRRLSSEFDLYSAPGAGTAVVSRLWNSPSSSGAAMGLPFAVGGVCLPFQDRDPCGDAWAVRDLSGRLVVLLADGLGHGEDAAVAANTAIALFRSHPAGAREVVEAIHTGLRATRGGAIAAAEIDVGRRLLHYTGIGNVSARICGAGTSRNLISHNGIAGAEARKIQEFTYPWPLRGVLIMHSDGLATRWNLDDYPGLPSRHPSLVAGVLYRDFARGRDDVTVLAVKEAEQP